MGPAELAAVQQRYEEASRFAVNSMTAAIIDQSLRDIPALLQEMRRLRGELTEEEMAIAAGVHDEWIEAQWRKEWGMEPTPVSENAARVYPLDWSMQIRDIDAGLTEVALLDARGEAICRIEGVGLTAEGAIKLMPPQLHDALHEVMAYHAPTA